MGPHWDRQSLLRLTDRTDAYYSMVPPMMPPDEHRGSTARMGLTAQPIDTQQRERELRARLLKKKNKVDKDAAMADPTDASAKGQRPIATSPVPSNDRNRAISPPTSMPSNSVEQNETIKDHDIASGRRPMAALPRRFANRKQAALAPASNTAPSGSPSHSTRQSASTGDHDMSSETSTHISASNVLMGPGVYPPDFNVTLPSSSNAPSLTEASALMALAIAAQMVTASPSERNIADTDMTSGSPAVLQASASTSDTPSSNISTSLGQEQIRRMAGNSRVRAALATRTPQSQFSANIGDQGAFDGASISGFSNTLIGPGIIPPGYNTSTTLLNDSHDSQEMSAPESSSDSRADIIVYNSSAASQEALFDEDAARRDNIRITLQPTSARYMKPTNANYPIDEDFHDSFVRELMEDSNSMTPTTLQGQDTRTNNQLSRK